MPVSSYAPELLELFKEAAHREVTIKLGEKKQATRLRARFHSLRTAMRREDHPLTQIANSVQFSIDPSFNLICYPADTHFLDAIRGAGISITQPTTQRTNQKSTEAEDALADFLKGEE